MKSYKVVRSNDRKFLNKVGEYKVPPNFEDKGNKTLMLIYFPDINCCQIFRREELEEMEYTHVNI